MSSANKEECTGSDIMVGGKKVGVNRIQRLGIRNLKVEAQMGQGGGWVPMRSDGTFIEPAANKTVSGSASNQTFGNNNTQPNSPNANTGSTKQGTQQFNNQQSMPNKSSNGTISSQKGPQSNPIASNQAELQRVVSQNLQKAQQSSNSPILQAMYLSNAKTTATVAGDEATVRQITQQQEQLRIQSQQRLAEATTQAVGSILNAISFAQERKREREASSERWRNEEVQRRNEELLKIAEIEKKTAPKKKLVLEQLQERMNTESDSYGNSSTASDKLSHALSWLCKWKESIKIVGSKPKVRSNSYSNLNGQTEFIVDVLSEGYVNASSYSLLSAAELNEKLGMSELAGLDLVSKEAPKLLYPIDFPRKATKFKDKVKFWYPGKREKLTTVDRIEREYLNYAGHLFRNEKFNNRVDGLQLSYLKGTYISADKYPEDSVECVRDGEKKYRYWKGSSSKSIYEAGFVPQKKLEAQLLHASLLLDSAIAFNAPATLSRSAAIYRDAFEWYLKGPVRWLKTEVQPALLIRESMWRYAVAVAAASKNSPAADNSNDPHPELAEAFTQHFEQYLQQPISQVNEPMKLDK
jgi:chemotaxis protein histidine kinase CheA